MPKQPESNHINASYIPNNSALELCCWSLPFSLDGITFNYHFQETLLLCPALFVSQINSLIATP
jgi:hypothetical protein